VNRPEQIRPPATASDRQRDRPSVTVRVSPGPYIAAAFFLTFLSAFLVYLELDSRAVVGVFLLWLLVPTAAFFDRIHFNGRRLRRTGPVAWLSSRFLGIRQTLKLSDIEQVDTQALRAFRRGGRVIYRYRTTFHGKEKEITIVSGGAAFREMVRLILPQLSTDLLDARSIELRDYLTDPGEVRLRANAIRIPSADVLETSLKKREKRRAVAGETAASDKAEGDPIMLRRLANELRLSGSLLRAIEAFRRAVMLSPRDPWLLYEFSRCLISYAAAERDEPLERRARAMMRLAEKRAGDDPELLNRIGESYFQIGDWDRAAAVFRNASERLGESFRSLRGLAEIALREGKIAHVIHNFAAANRLADTAALRRWTQREMDYFSRLNEDEEYMDLEVSRVNLLEKLVRGRRTSMRITLLALPLIILGVLLDDSLIANIGWGVAWAGTGFWIALLIGRKVLEARIPFDMLDRER
jgi:tetratricopeptide (TPR) repeat protein